MAKAADPAPTLTVGELEANYPPYCKAMRILAREGKSATKARRTPSAGSGWRCCTTAYLTSIAIPTISICSCLASGRHPDAPDGPSTILSRWR